MRRNIPKPHEPVPFYFPLRGGLDLVTPPYQIKPGKMLDCFRYELGPSGGYKPIDGYERVDGHGVPSLASYQCVVFTDPSKEIAAGAIVTGATSAAVGISLASGDVDFEGDGVLEDMAGAGAFLLRSGQFVDGENVTVLGVVVATIDTVYLPDSERYYSHERYFYWLAVERLRSMVAVVPGSGVIRGVWRYKGDMYAFRDNAGGTACVMFKEDATAGWKAVAGVPALVAGGKYEFVNTNFGGSSVTVKMYGCDGKNKAFQFDGTIFTQISTGMAVDTPSKIIEHKLMLFLGFSNGSLQFSPVGDPTGIWTVITGAGELGMGEELNAIKSLPGGTLGVFCDYSLHLLSGSSTLDFVLTCHSKESGAKRGTVQLAAGAVLFLNETGIAKLSATSAFGSFKAGTASDDIQPLLDMRKGAAVSSVAVNAKNQYRIFFEGGYFFTGTSIGRDIQWTQGFLDVVPRCIAVSVRADDETSNIYFGSDDGYIYKMDSGVSLDHNKMTGYFRVPFSHQGAPRKKKRYREVVLEIDSFGGKQLQLFFVPDFSFSQDDIPQHKNVDVSETTANAGTWDVSDWNNFNWLGSEGGGGTASGRIDGVATEMGLMFYFYAVDTVTPLHALNGVFIYYNMLGRQR